MSLSKAVKELENENYNIKNSTKQQEYNIGIYGTGELGGNTYLELMKTSTQDIYSKINRIYLFGKTEEKPFLWKQAGMINKKRRSIKTKTYSHNQLPDFLQDIDILIFSASKGNKYSLEKSIAQNKKIINRISSFFCKDYNGLVIVASNQTDALCNELAHKSKINPLRIIGFNSLDEARYRTALEQHFSEYNLKDIEAYTIGFHHNSLMLTSKTRINGIPLDDLVSEEELRKINYIRRELATKASRELGTTTNVAAPALKELVLSVMEEDRETTVSTIIALKNIVLYMSMPVKFHNLQPLIKDVKPEIMRKQSFKEMIDSNEWLNSIPPEEQRLLERTIEKQENFMKKQGIWRLQNIDLERINYDIKLTTTRVKEHSYEIWKREKEFISKKQAREEEEFLKIIRFMKECNNKNSSMVKN